MDRTTPIHMIRKINVTDLSGEKVMVDYETGKYYMIQGTGSDIWDLIQEDTTVGEIVDKLRKEYEVSEEECEAGVISFLEKFKSYGIIE